MFSETYIFRENKVNTRVVRKVRKLQVFCPGIDTEFHSNFLPETRANSQSYPNSSSCEFVSFFSYSQSLQLLVLKLSTYRGTQEPNEYMKSH